MYLGSTESFGPNPEWFKIGPLTFFRLIFWLLRSWFLSWNWFCCVFLWFCVFSWCVFVCFFRWVFWLWCGFAWAWLFCFLCFYSTCLFRKYRLFIWYLKQSVYQTINKYKHTKRANTRAKSLWWHRSSNDRSRHKVFSKESCGTPWTDAPS